MGNVSITLGSSFYSSGGDTINPKTWPAAPTGDGNSPGTGGDSGGSTGGGGGGSSYDQTTLDAIAYVNSVLSQGYYTTPYSATSSHHTDVGADASAWGSYTTASLENIYDMNTSNTYTATYDRVSQIDSTTETSLDAAWGSITPTIADPTGSEFAFSSDGNTNNTAFGYLNISSPTGQGYGVYTPFLRLNESLILFIEFLYNDGYQMNTPSSIDWASYSGMPGSYNNLNEYSGNSPSLTIDPGQSIISVIKDFAQLYAEASGGTLASGASESSSRSIFDYGSSDQMGSGYNWTFGLGRVTSIA